MKVLEKQIVSLSKYLENPPTKSIVFLRVDPEDLSIAIRDILVELADFSWLNKFDREFLKESFRVNAMKTCDALKEKFYDSEENPIISEAGEYIVSVCAKRGIVEELSYIDIPLSELLGRKKTGNPGFDFYVENGEDKMLACGEAKYLHNQNAYGSSLEQIHRFIDDDKHISDITMLSCLASDRSLQNMCDGKFGVCAAFSSTNISTDNLLKHIFTNSDFLQCLQYEFIILVAVNIYEN